MKVYSLAVLALIGEVHPMKVTNLYEYSEGPTKADYGENDNVILGREADLATDDKSKKESGWVNPLSVSDDGMDDDQVLMMNFKNLDKSRKWRMPKYTLDEDIIASQKSESLAEITVPLNAVRFEEQRKQAEIAAAEAAKKAAEEAAKLAADKAKKAAEDAKKAAVNAKAAAEEANKMKKSAEQNLEKKQAEAKKLESKVSSKKEEKKETKKEEKKQEQKQEKKQEAKQEKKESKVEAKQAPAKASQMEQDPSQQTFNVDGIKYSMAQIFEQVNTEDQMPKPVRRQDEYYDVEETDYDFE